MVTVVGIGPGHPDYMTPAALRRIEAADVVIVGRRLLDSLGHVVDLSTKEIHFVTGDIDAAMCAIQENCARNLAVVVSGDPGFFSLLKTIRERLPEIRVSAVPGISSMQALFGLIGEDWVGVDFVSVHGRSFDALGDVLSRKKRVCVLTDDRITGVKLAQYLHNLGVRGRAVAGKNLSYPDQILIDETIEEMSKRDGLESCVLYIEI